MNDLKKLVKDLAGKTMDMQTVAQQKLEDLRKTMQAAQAAAKIPASGTAQPGPKR